ncbi:MAG TPA: biotin/lipoyl-binding protein [Bacteroidales bacterium]|nr:biotin/lipoyl-binding protein [Bacteroidales bacterium]HPI85129.1 biotin/lipoyl-binding protein [Bacteroidales bacterium]HPM93189.1 biotin/lipoyl-binding protein [Bacteroidales bacterium]
MRTFKFKIKGQEYEVEIKKLDNNIAEVEVNGSLYQVEVSREPKQSKTPILVRSEPSVPKSAHKFKKKISGTIEVRSPLPGNIMQVFVREADEVKKGDKLIVYEAMKMENTIYAEKDGIVAKVKVKPGDTILEGDVLMEIG